MKGIVTFFGALLRRSPPAQEEGSIAVRFAHHDFDALKFCTFVHSLRRIIDEWRKTKGRRILKGKWEVVVSVEFLAREKTSKILITLVQADSQFSFTFSIVGVEHNQETWQTLASKTAGMLVAVLIQHGEEG